MASLRDIRSKVADINALSERIKSTTQVASYAPDTRFWKPTRDKNGNGYAVIRFLPAPENEDLPFIIKWQHSFEHPTTKKYYIEDSLTTINLPDPVGDYNQKIWSTGLQAHQDFVRKYSKRRLHYIANILVINDSANPENNNKVFLYDFGRKIYNKIHAAMEPEFPDDPKINPFDPWEGANFKLKIKTVDGYPNYDASVFDDVSAIGDDDTIDRIWKSEHSLQEILSPKNFKTYEQLLKRFNNVMGFSEDAAKHETAAVSERPAKQTETTTEPAVVAKVEAPAAEDDDDEGFINRLRDQLQGS
jgi:hypothetical protein